MRQKLRRFSKLQKNKMNTKFKKIRVSNLMVNAIKKDIKNIHLGVYPPDGRIRISAPLKTNDETIRLLILSKASWIKKQQVKFLRQERQTKREYVSRESHYLFGRRYLLNIIHTDAKPKIEIKRKIRIDLYIQPNSTTKQREVIFEKFYRAEMRKLVPILLKKWQKKVGVKVKEVKIRKMKTKWGTCKIADKRIWLNLELVKKPSKCIDYVFVHELVHLREKGHSQRFIDILESVLPNWKSLKAELNESPLGYSKWQCVVN